MTEVGTQKPIGVFFVVSRTEPQPHVSKFSPDSLAELFAGTPNCCISDEYAVFTDRTSADNFAKRSKLCHLAVSYVNDLSLEQLEGIMPVLDLRTIDHVLTIIDQMSKVH